MTRPRIPHLMIVLGSLIGVLTVAVVDLGRSSPGRITRVHGQIDELSAGESCSQCHGNWFESMGDACLECHETISDHLERNVGLHGRLADVEADRCSTCHSEHHGETFSMVNRQSFVMAGVADFEEFDHGMIGWDMDGEHLELDCTECHENAELAMIPEGETRYIGLDRSCVSCHEDSHDGAMRQACANCHVQTSFEEHRLERHAEFWPRFGSHDEAECRDCHEADSDRSLESHMAGLAPPGQRECAACHESPHRLTFLLGNARASELPQDSSCALCHDPEVHAFLGDEVGMTSEQHAFSGFGIAGAPHEEVECADCHTNATPNFRERFPGRDADDCASCHETPHGEQFETDGFSNGRCVTCHASTHFEPHAFSPEMHAMAAITIDGAHAELDCAECHEAFGKDETRRFFGTPDRCEDCHSDAHEGFFGSLQKQLASTQGGECATCHTTGEFSQLPEDGFAHEDFTGFPMRGAHAASRCEVCHARSADPDEHGRTFGRITEHFGEVQDCASCHVDVHEGRFDERGMPKKFEGRVGCERCHDETSFRSMPYGFDHDKWNRFPLSGAHEKASCSACHKPLRPSAESAHGGRTWGAARGNQCADCHQDPHASQFVVDGATDCSSCHKSAHSFSELSFNHNIDSEFPLDNTHATLECSACHKPVQVGEAEVLRYRPLGSECADCHGVNQDVLRRSQRRGR